MNKYFEKAPFVDEILKGMGQIMLQENRWTGLLFIIGLFVGGWQYGIAAIVADTAGTLTAKLLKYNPEEIHAGLYGFSPALVGVALIFLFDNTPLIWVFILIGGAFAAIVQHLFIIKKVPGYTFPFIVAAWTLVFLLRHYVIIPASDLIHTNSEFTRYDNFLAIANGFGQVIFQASFLTSVIFFIGVFIGNHVAALYGLAASLLGIILSLMNGQPVEQIHLGLFGFNAVLTAIALSGNKKWDGLWVLIGSAITIIIDNFLVDYHLLDAVGGVFTFPFVAGTWITLLIKNAPLKKS
ncbi:MAG: urea transporter [Chitinophagaceae bacterium]|nr:MAG: urea transporter [Chitinophagaceae bacterium]